MNKFFKWGLSVLALSVLAACGGNSSSHATGLTSSQSHATGLTSESSHATGLTSDESSHATGLTSEESSEESNDDSDATSEESSEPVLYLAGSFNGWTQFDETYKMEYHADLGVFNYQGLNAKAGYEFKVMGTVNGNTEWYPANNYVFTEAGKYNILFELDTAYLEVERMGDYEGEVTEVTYFLVGAFNSWKQKDETYTFTKVSDNEYTITAALTAGGVKVMDSDGLWYPSGTGNDGQIPADGDYKVTFDPAGGHEGWHEGYFLVEAVAA